jgi:replication factor A1
MELAMDEDRELNEKIAELRAEFGELLNEEAIRKLALEELGKLVLNRKQISDLKNREGASLEVRVVKIYETREFNRKDGSTGYLRKILVEDDSGSCQLTLWDEDIKIPETLGIAEGSRLALVNCYIKISDFGVDVNKGKIGKIDVMV